MRKLVKSWFALIAIIVFTNGANAQQPSTIFLGNLFKGDSVDLADGAAQNFKDAARRARDDLAPGQCPKTTITMSVTKGDDLFQQALIMAQREILQGLLGGNAQSFVFNLDWKGTSPSVQIDPVTDNAAPRITVSPPSGTKMKERAQADNQGDRNGTGERLAVRHQANSDRGRRPAQQPAALGQ